MKIKNNRAINIRYILPLLYMFTLVIAYTPIIAQPFKAKWVQNIGNVNRDIINDMALDRAGNIYSIGSFSGAFQVDGQTGMTANGAKDAFVYKTSKDGKLLWSKQIGSKGQDFACRLALSLNGKLYVIGGFDKSADAGRQKNVNTDRGLYVSQFSSSGDVKWVKYFSSNEFNHYTGITTGADNSVYVMGCFYDSLALDDHKWIAKPGGSIFVARFSSEGDLLVFKQFEGSGEKYPSVIQYSGSDVWIGGHYTRNLKADSLKLSTNNPSRKEIFALSFDKDLNVGGGWTIAEGTHVFLSSMVADSTGTVYLGGHFSDSINVQGQIVKALGEQDVFVTAIDTLGRSIWTKRAGGLRSNSLADMAQNHENELILAFASNSAAKYDSLPELEHKGFNDIQLAAIDSTGKFLWSTAFGGISEDFPCKLAVDKEDQIVFSASYKESLSIGDRNMSSVGDQDILIAKLKDCSKQKAHLLGDTLLCIGSAGQVSAADASYQSYQWEYGAGVSQSFPINKAGVYHFGGIDHDGCSVSDSIKVRSLPLPAFSLGKDTSIFEPQCITIQPDSILMSYQWQDGSCLSAYTLCGKDAGLGLYPISLKGTDTNGCAGVDSLWVRVKPVDYKTNEALNTAHISIYPNPAHEHVSYSIDMSFQQLVVRVVDTYGHVYLEKSVQNYIEGTQDELNISMLIEGMYYIKVYAGSVVKSQVFYVK